MNHQRLEGLTLEALQEEARRYGLSFPDYQPDCIDAIMTHLELNGPLIDFQADCISNV